MKLSIYNTLTRKREKFTPLHEDKVKMYVCGPTVYDHPHLGNARSIVVYDILFRILNRIYNDSNVIYVRNITDVDDKIIERARVLGITTEELTTQTIKDFHEDTKYLNCLEPTIEPKATEHIKEMQDIIAKLIDNGFAYVTDAGDIYFKVNNAKDYFTLSNRSSGEAQINSRIQNNIAKINAEDFVLWKASDDIKCSFESPWGRGRPGWHIECSAMSHKHLGENFDIHGGGADLIFPHHTNEIAQSMAAFPESNFANYWVHNGFLTVNSEKMSKSLGNFITVKDFRDRKVLGEVVRLLLLSTHYRKPLDYNEKALRDAKKTLDYWYGALEKVQPEELDKYFTDNYDPQLTKEPFDPNWIHPNSLLDLLDDLNTPGMIRQINDLAKMIHADVNSEMKIKYTWQLKIQANFLGLLKCLPDNWFGQEQSNEQKIIIEEIIIARNRAKASKNWQEADSLRKKAEDLGIALIDKKDGTTSWQKLIK